MRIAEIVDGSEPAEGLLRRRDLDGAIGIENFPRPPFLLTPKDFRTATVEPYIGCKLAPGGSRMGARQPSLRRPHMWRAYIDFDAPPPRDDVVPLRGKVS